MEDNAQSVRCPLQAELTPCKVLRWQRVLWTMEMRLAFRQKGRGDHAHLWCVCPMGAIVSSLFSFSSPTHFHHLLMKAQYFAKRVEDEKFLSC